MKKRITTLLAMPLFCILLFIGCTPEPKIENKKINNLPSETAAIWVLNEGLFNSNNSSLTYFDFSKKQPEQNYFQKQNLRGLGDSGNDLQLYGGKIYCVMNVSSQIEVINPFTGKSIKQIPMLDENNSPREPRCIAFHENKAYVCSFDGTVCRIDTTSLVIEAIVNAGRNPDAICIANNKIYVSNSGGLDFPNFDKTISVIDIVTFKEIKKITVESNPYKIQADTYGDIYVISRGDQEKNRSCLQRINTHTDEVVQTFENINPSNFIIAGDLAYLYSYSYVDNTNWVKVFNVKTEKIVKENFITDNTKINMPYGIGVDPYSNNVYIMDANNYSVLGDVYCFSNDGKLKFNFEAGLNPNNIVFIKK